MTSRSGAATTRSLTSLNPASVSACLSAPGLPRLKGPGWPAAGGGSLARSRMIDTGSEKNALFCGVE